MSSNVSPHGGPSTVQNVLGRAAEQWPDRTGFVFQRLDGHPDTVTYRELLDQAAALATKLRAAASSHSGVVLQTSWGLDHIVAFFGTCLAGLTPVSMPPARTAPAAREASARWLGEVLDATDSRVVVSSPETDVRLSRLGLADRGITVIATDASQSSSPEMLVQPSVEDALVQFSSGSTGRPKGVRLTHSNVVANLEQIAHILDVTSNDVGVSWLPLYHDMGFVGGVLVPLWCGAKSVLLPPESFLFRPTRWLEAITEHSGSISFAPSSAYSRAADDVPRAELDLGSWRIAGIGGDAIDVGALRRFVDTYSNAGFLAENLVPAYGLAEATLLVSAATGGCARVMSLGPDNAVGRAVPLAEVLAREDPGQQIGREVVGCGVPADGTRIRIVDPELRDAPVGSIGEVLVAGPSVSLSYVGRDEVSAHSDAWLHTGDLGCLYKGELFITGRTKNVVIVDGRNIWAEDVEAAAMSVHEDLLDAAAFGIQRRWGEALALALSVRQPEVDAAALATVVRERVAEVLGATLSHVAVCRRNGLPRTTSGKIRREACAQALADGTLPAIYEWTDEGEVAARIGAASPAADPVGPVFRETVAQVLRGPIDMRQSFVSNGGTSGKATQVAARIYQLVGVQLAASRLLQAESLDSFLDQLELTQAAQTTT